MPNWCENHLTIEAEPHVITALLAKAKSKSSPDSEKEVPFSYLPFFQEKIDACEDFEKQWYDFMLANVGCKWFPEIDPELVSIEPAYIGVSFDSPWSPPVEGTRVIAEWLRAQGFAFQIELTYQESGCAFCGVFTADQHGDEDQCGDYQELDAEELRNGKEEDYAGECERYGISFAELQARATEDMEYIVLCPDFYRPHANDF